ncbi:hypothetical protein K503DRAFT_748583 [Rhizopogon vinicolor AM-OR11-026]|uniref:DUF1295-domain-containing protein n=1 Tax=Rhizopogon vinicolor AM-OR11-026 TaxID=1314800 RepID=A0A1B7MLX1_9AGAM|nr:hypothetical protein K503DRAFT_748583 [Rhizopogon vinicolor AM-OR11-026]
MDIWRILPDAPIFLWPIKLCLANGAMFLVAVTLSQLVSHARPLQWPWTLYTLNYANYYAFLPDYRLGVPTLWGKYYVPETIPAAVRETHSPRAVLMTRLLMVWVVSLSCQKWQRGILSPRDEDCFWVVTQTNIHPFVQHVFNITFGVIGRSVISFLLALPVADAVAQPHTALVASDYILATLAILAILTAFVAESQRTSFEIFSGQLSFLRWHIKWFDSRIQWTEHDAERGFVTRGLWAWSRHPDRLCELIFWFIFNLFPMLSPDSPGLNVPPGSHIPLTSLLPCLSLCLWTSISTLLIDSCKRVQYPVYAAYQARVSMFVPLLTPVWGALLRRYGRRDVDMLVYGDGSSPEEKEMMHEANMGGRPRYRWRKWRSLADRLANPEK